jgi:hypothetical protein
LDPANILSTLVKLPEVITPTGETLTMKNGKNFQPSSEPLLTTWIIIAWKRGKGIKE